MTDRCVASISYALIDNTYVYMYCSLVVGHEGNHQAIQCWSQEIEDDEDAR